MFGRKKMYKKGLAGAMCAYEDFGKKQEAALKYMREEVRNGNKKLEDALVGLGEDLNGIYKYLNSKEKDALYHLSTPMDIKELDGKYQHLLLAVLNQLSNDEGDALTDNQRAYTRSVKRYLGIVNPQTSADFSAIENIDSIDVQKTFLRVALEFFYLQDGDELSDQQEEFLDYFSINKKQATVIENEVSRLFNAVGPQGVAEKYGYVPDIPQKRFEPLNNESGNKLTKLKYSEKVSDLKWKRALAEKAVYINFINPWMNVEEALDAAIEDAKGHEFEFLDEAPEVEQAEIPYYIFRVFDSMESTALIGDYLMKNNPDMTKSEASTKAEKIYYKVIERTIQCNPNLERSPQAESIFLDAILYPYESRIIPDKVFNEELAGVTMADAIAEAMESVESVSPNMNREEKLSLALKYVREHYPELFI